MGDGAYGWIGACSARGPDPADRAERAPSLVVSAAHSAVGAVRRVQVRVGEVTVLLSPAGGQAAAPARERAGGRTEQEAPRDRAGVVRHGGRDAAEEHQATATAGWVRSAVLDELDVGAHLAAELDLLGREGEDDPAGRWTGTLPASRYAAFRTADPEQAETLARAVGCPAELVRALADPVALSRVEVVRRDGATLDTGPTTVVTDELAWVDGGEDGLWTVRPGGPDELAIGRGSPSEVAAAVAGMVRAAEGC